MNDRRSGATPYGDLARRTSGGRSSKGLIIGVVAVVVVAALAVVAVLLAGGDDESTIDATQEAAGVQVTGDPLPAYPEVGGFVAPADQDGGVGKVPPTLTGEDFEGEPVTIAPGDDGRAKVVVFLAHWCPHCQKEVPVIQDWVDAGNLPDDVDLVAVSTAASADRPNYPPSKWLGREGWTSPVLLDNADSSAATAWGLTGFPYMVFVDADGKVVRRASGEVPVADFDALVKELATG